MKSKLLLALSILPMTLSLSSCDGKMTDYTGREDIVFCFYSKDGIKPDVSYFNDDRIMKYEYLYLYEQDLFGYWEVRSKAITWEEGKSEKYEYDYYYLRITYFVDDKVDHSEIIDKRGYHYE